jgi:hypothetical protein
MRRVLLAILLGLPVSLSAASADDVSLVLDEVRTVTFPQAVGTVNVGNPAIADITMIDSRRAFILGKGYGTTNIIALGKDGEPVSNTRISVMSRQATVTLNRGTQRVTYNCAAGHCEVAPQPGDGKDADATTSQLAAHQDAAAKAATGPGN